jgi:hypothetical protein
MFNYAIVVKYLGPTGTKGGRLKVETIYKHGPGRARKSLTVPYNHALNATERVATAALAFVAKFDAENVADLENVEVYAIPSGWVVVPK